jgi:arylformamidase
MFIELSFPLYEGAPACFFNTVQNKIIPILRIADGDILNTTELRLSTHNGTHMDAPWHFNDEGKKLDDLTIEDWIFDKPRLIDLSGHANCDIERSEIEPHISKDDDVDLLLIYTGLSRLRETDPQAYSERFPGFTDEAARFIIEGTRVRGLAIDFISVESAAHMTATTFSAHHILLGCRGVSERGIMLIEDANLAPLLGKKIKRVFSVPLPVKGIDASPVNLFAEVE